MYPTNSVKIKKNIYISHSHKVEKNLGYLFSVGNKKKKFFYFLKKKYGFFWVTTVFFSNGFYQMSKVVIVTGCHGCLGQKIVKTCIAQGISVFGIDLIDGEMVWKGNNSHFQYSSWNISFPHEQLLLDHVQEFVANKKLVALIHCAAEIDTSLSALQCYAVNHLGTLRVLHFMHCLGLKKLVFVSTNQIAFEQQYIWKWLHTCYMKSKMLAEDEIIDFGSKHYDFQFQIIRPGLIYGEGDAFFWKIEQSSRFGIPFRCQNDIMWEGNEIEDLSGALVFQAISPSIESSICNVASPIRSFEHWNQRLMEKGKRPLTKELPKVCWIAIGIFWEILLACHLLSDFIALFFLIIPLLISTTFTLQCTVLGMLTLLFSFIERKTLQNNFLYLSIADAAKMSTSHARKLTKPKPRKE